jgi:hypothetical protein
MIDLLASGTIAEPDAGPQGVAEGVARLPAIAVRGSPWTASEPELRQITASVQDAGNSPPPRNRNCRDAVGSDRNDLNIAVPPLVGELVSALDEDLLCARIEACIRLLEQGVRRQELMVNPW